MGSPRAFLIAAIVAAAIALLWLLFRDGNWPDAQREQERDIATESATFSPSLESIPPAARSRLEEILSGCEPLEGFAGLSDDESAKLWDQARSDAQRILADSSDAEHLVVAALLERFDNPDRSFELLTAASRLAPKDPIISWNQLDACRWVAGRCGADRAEIERRAIRNDRGNAAVWATLAAIRVREDDAAGALAALQRAATSPYFDTYIGERIMMYDRALAASTNLASLDRLAIAWATGISMADGSTALAEPCRKHGSHSHTWRDACLQFGELLTSKGTTMLNVGIGLAIQQVVHELNEDDVEFRRVEQEQSEAREWFSPNRMRIIDRIVFRDEQLLRAFADVFFNEGEFAAWEYAETEVARLVMDPEFDPCNGKDDS